RKRFESGVKIWASMYKCEPGTSVSVVNWNTSSPLGEFLSSKSGRGLRLRSFLALFKFGAVANAAAPRNPFGIKAAEVASAVERRKFRRVFTTASMAWRGAASRPAGHSTDTMLGRGQLPVNGTDWGCG